MYIPDNYDAYRNYEAEQARRERLCRREEIEEEKEDLINEQFTDTCKPTTRNYRN